MSEFPCVDSSIIHVELNKNVEKAVKLTLLTKAPPPPFLICPPNLMARPANNPSSRGEKINPFNIYSLLMFGETETVNS